MTKCASCRQPFDRLRANQQVCSVECAAALAKTRREKQEQRKAQETRRQIREAKERIKSRTKWIAEAQSAFNAWIRWRDRNLPCISCGRFHTGAWDAGHYQNAHNHSAIRFDERNVHRQCVPCNQHQGGNKVEYRRGLVERVGVEIVEFLEGPHENKKWTIDEAREIKAKYRALLAKARKEETCA